MLLMGRLCLHHRVRATVEQRQLDQLGAPGADLVTHQPVERTRIHGVLIERQLQIADHPPGRWVGVVRS
jgi:hypothetical protein